MQPDARTLQLLLYVCGRSLRDFESKPLPKSVLRFLDSADRAGLQSCLVEVLCRLENLSPAKKAAPGATRPGQPKRRGQ
jgi:hypothetical protein